MSTSTRELRSLDRPSFVTLTLLGVALLAALLIASQRESVTAAIEPPRVLAAITAETALDVERRAAPAREGAEPAAAPVAAGPERAFDRTLIASLAGEIHVAPVRARERADQGALMTVLHGACSSVAWTCERTAAAAPAEFLVACPTGNATCDDGADWVGDGESKARHLDAALASLRAHSGLAELGQKPGVLVGFSRGAFVARDVVYARPGRYRGLVLIGAALSPDPALLRANGIERVVLAAGDLDGAAPTMRSAREKLERGGVPARFISLGPVYHTLPEDTVSRLEEPLRWLTSD